MHINLIPQKYEFIYSSHYLGKKDGLGGSESNDAEEQRNESHNLQLGDGKKRDQLLKLLFLATSWNEENVKIISLFLKYKKL